MREIKKTLLIFKARWPEVAVIVGLFAVRPLSSILIEMADNSDIPYLGTFISLIIVLAALLLLIIIIILTCGFERSVYLSGTSRSSFLCLLNLGKHFFGRIFVFGIIFAIAFFLLQWLVSIPIAPLLCPDKPFFQRVKECPMFFAFSTFLTSLILVKVTVFVTALIIVLNCKLLESFKLLKHCKLTEAKEPVLLYFASMLLTQFLWILSQNLNLAGTEHYLYATARSVLHSFLYLLWSVLAIRYVASLNLKYPEHAQFPVGNDTTNQISTSL